MRVLIISFTLIFVSYTAFAQTPCNNTFDNNNDGSVTVSDLLELLIVFGDSDSDSDGIWDSLDSCIDFSACNYSANPTESCLYIDALNICGGLCSGDQDSDGICDDVDDCFGVVDVCGVCGGSGPLYSIVNSITILYDSLYSNTLDVWVVFEIGADTIFTYECPPPVNTIDCGGVVSHKGYDYSTVLIGSQCWFSENCRYLASVSPSNIESDSVPYYYVYGYEGVDTLAAKSTENYLMYGALYNFKAVSNGNLCPAGWHIPNDLEWIELTNFIGELVAGVEMKTSSGWNNNGNGSNSSGFSGLPGGSRSYNGVFSQIGDYGFWWSSTNANSTSSWYRLLYQYHDNVYKGYYPFKGGLSARCLQD